jgi:hypothetical protein
VGLRSLALALGCVGLLGVSRGFRKNKAEREHRSPLVDMNFSMFDLVSRAGVQLRGKLGVEAVSTDQVAGVRTSASSNSEAARLYAEGLAKLRVFEALAARDLLVKAVAAEPGYRLAHSALAAAWSALGYDGKDKEESTLAFNLS